MDEKRSVDDLLIVMKNLNLLIVLYIAAVMSYSLSGYIKENSALEFLTKIPTVPLTAWKIPVIVLCLYVSFLLVLYIQNITIRGLALKVCIEIGIVFFISYLFGFSYTGLILVILADTMKYFPQSKWRFPFAVFICLVYLLTDYGLLSAYFDVIPFEAYLGYYGADARSAIVVIKNICVSLNIFLFLLYMILLVRMQTSEKERILNLNEELNAVNEELRQANVQLAEYASEAEKMVETRERNRLAREIHDTLGHALTGIITGLEACMAIMDVAPEATKLQLKAIADVARQGMTDVRRSVKALRPDALEKLPLEKALANTVEEMRSATGAEITYHCTAALKGFNEDEEDVIYRIVQESITNAIRHGEATKIAIDISRKYQMLTIHIQDNGIGCQEITKGFGLHHMEERISLLNGTLSYSGGNGFLIEAQIPIRWGEHTDD